MKASSFFLIMACFNVVIGLATIAMYDMGGTAFMDMSDTVLSNMTSSGTLNGTMISTYEDTELTLSDSVDVGAGSSFTDSFRSMKTWYGDTNGVFGWFGFIVRMPVMFLSKMGFPEIIVTAVSVIWYFLTVVSIVAFAIGRDQ